MRRGPPDVASAGPSYRDKDREPEAKDDDREHQLRAARMLEMPAVDDTNEARPAGEYEQRDVPGAVGAVKLNTWLLSGPTFQFTPSSSIASWCQPPPSLCIDVSMLASWILTDWPALTVS